MAVWPLASLVLLVVAWGTRRVWLAYPAPPYEPRHLSRREYATLASAALATFPRGGDVSRSGLDAGIPSFVDRYLGIVTPRTRALMRLLLFLIEHGTLLFPAPGLGGFRRFSALAPPQQAAYLSAWQRSRLFPRRVVFVSLRALLTMAYFADPGVLRALGLAPRAIETPVCEADLLWPAIGRTPETIHLSRADLTAPSDGSPLGPSGPLHPDYEGGAP